MSVQVKVDRDELTLPTESVVRAVLGIHPKFGAPGLMLECALCDNTLGQNPLVAGGISCRTCGYNISPEERDRFLDIFIECIEHLKLTTKTDERKKRSIWQLLMFWKKRA